MDIRALSVEEARELDRRAVAELGLPTLLLMENAARGVAERARALGQRWVILCGAGNNGGDGLAAARHLGYDAIVHLLAAPDPAKCPDAALQLRVLERAGFAIHRGDPDPRAHGPEVVWIDALFGTGLARPLAGHAADWVARFDRAAGPKLSVDLPSGLDGDSGVALGGIACHADETVSFHAPKLGLLMPTARAFVGRLSVVPLGLPPGWPRD
ncbi:MAG: NAD(P)H-hydrate epimerase [Planctomycetes bacterium]|nr:NAD(P)H-hydrate epimerase [Planctomycetota bacterium]